MKCDLYLDIPNKDEQYLDKAWCNIKKLVIEFTMQNNTLLNAVLAIADYKKPIKGNNGLCKKAKELLPKNISLSLESFIRNSDLSYADNIRVLSAIVTGNDSRELVLMYRTCILYSGNYVYQDYFEVPLFVIPVSDNFTEKTITDNLLYQKIKAETYLANIDNHFAELESLGLRAEQLRKDYHKTLNDFKYH